MRSPNWTRAEIEAAVADYMDMLACEVRGEPFNKAAHNRALQARLDGRTKGSVERKHQNISAVLIAEGLPYIDGYKPLRNVQADLRKAVQERIREVAGLIRADVEARQVPVVVGNVLGIEVEPPNPGELAVGERRSDYLIPGTAPGPVDYLLREAQNRSLGDAGEALVMDYERLRLERAGKDHLARERRAGVQDRRRSHGLRHPLLRGEWQRPLHRGQDDALRPAHAVLHQRRGTPVLEGARGVLSALPPIRVSQEPAALHVARPRGESRPAPAGELPRAVLSMGKARSVGQAWRGACLRTAEPGRSRQGAEILTTMDAWTVRRLAT